MEKEINIPIVLDVVRKVGNDFLKDFRKGVIPENRAELLEQLDAIDIFCLTSLKRDLADAFPEISWQTGDEFDLSGQKNPAKHDEYWLCDAMDGAIQYVRHIAGWTINLALIRDGKPFFAVIFDPLADEMFWAKEGEGACLNDQAIKPVIKTDFSVMVAVFEYGHQAASAKNSAQKIGATVTALIENFGVVRNYGPHGLQLAYTAAGRIDLFIQEDLDTYNWIAGILIAKEAGAKILTTDGDPWTWGSESLLVASDTTAREFLAAKSTAFYSEI